MPKGFSDNEKDLIAARLLEQGYRLFSTYGLKKTNVEELARAVGISKGAFYIFYDSKEELFMTVIEGVETRVRQQILADIELPGPTPRARLLATFKHALSLFESIPLLRFFTGADFDLVIRRLPAGKFQSHLASDMGFFETLVARCQEAGIPIRIPAGEIVTLLFPLVIAMLHESDLGEKTFRGSFDQLLELVSAYCVGEVELACQSFPASPAPEERSMP